MKAIYVNRLTRAGVKFVFWVADWLSSLCSLSTTPPTNPPPALPQVVVAAAYFVPGVPGLSLSPDHLEDAIEALRQA